MKSPDPASILHITNGDSAASAMAEAGIDGTIIPWRDVLHEGPVTGDLDLEGLRPVRSRFLSDTGWGKYDDILSMMFERDSVVHRFRQYQEVVLWFEHDLYDQLQLIQVLHEFAGWDLGETRLCLVGPSEYLSMVELERLQELRSKHQPVTRRQLDLGRWAWEAFGSPDPTVIQRLLGEDMTPLPFLKAALQRHFEEFPATTTGLSRSETQALEAIRDGAPTLADAFRAAHLDREDPLFLGDATFATYLERLSEGREPLILASDGQRIRPPTWQDDDDREFWTTRAVLTVTGQAVLAGRQDWLAIHEIDRWLGGVHLKRGSPIWRWDPATRQLEMTAP